MSGNSKGGRPRMDGRRQIPLGLLPRHREWLRSQVDSAGRPLSMSEAARNLIDAQIKSEG